MQVEAMFLYILYFYLSPCMDDIVSKADELLYQHYHHLQPHISRFLEPNLNVDLINKMH